MEPGGGHDRESGVCSRDLRSGGRVEIGCSLSGSSHGKTEEKGLGAVTGSPGGSARSMAAML